MTRRLFHITFPKCGSQWIRDVLSSQEIWPDFKLHPAKGVLAYTMNRNLFNSDGNFFSPIYGLSRHDWEALSHPEDRGIVVIRDPRDRLISLLFSILYSHSSNPRVDCWREVLSAQKSIHENLKFMLLTEGSNSLHAFYIPWCEAMPSNCIIIRYEDLVADQLGMFKKIAEWFEIKFSEEHLVKAIQQHSFETRTGRLRGSEDKFSHYRRGMPEDWRNYFTRSLGELCENLDPGILRKTGYETDDLWWKTLLQPDEISLDQTESHPHPSTLERDSSMAKRIKLLETENREKQRVIENLSLACEERLASIHQLEQVAKERLALIESLHTTAQERLMLIESLNNSTRSYK